MSIKLNLGSSYEQLPGFVNVDIVPGPAVDVVFNLDEEPWPWDDYSVSHIIASDIFEHVDKPLLFMNECWRVLETGGLLHLRTSYWKSENAFTAPDHKRFCTEHTFDFWVPGTDLHTRYGHIYAGKSAFTKEQAFLDGQELVFLLKRQDPRKDL